MVVLSENRNLYPSLSPALAHKTLEPTPFDHCLNLKQNRWSTLEHYPTTSSDDHREKRKNVIRKKPNFSKNNKRPFLYNAIDGD